MIPQIHSILDWRSGAIKHPPLRLALQEFKEKYCDENRIIARTFRRFAEQYELGTILDVGAGLGDLDVLAFFDKQVRLLDVDEYAPTGCAGHKRIARDFFDYKGKSKTIVFSHVLQYLDDDAVRLRKKIFQIDPKYIIETINTNEDEFGDIVFWAHSRFRTNPEMINLNIIPNCYRRIERVEIRATFECPSFEIMAYNLARVILDMKPSISERKDIEKKLNEYLTEPKMLIKQVVRLYEKR